MVVDIVLEARASIQWIRMTNPIRKKAMLSRSVTSAQTGRRAARFSSARGLISESPIRLAQPRGR